MLGMSRVRGGIGLMGAWIKIYMVCVAASWNVVIVSLGHIPHFNGLLKRYYQEEGQIKGRWLAPVSWRRNT